jgi:hypothetical protein
MSNRFKSSTGKYYSRQLFYEEWLDLPIEKRVSQPFFTLYKDKPGYINFGSAYVRLRDPTGYKVAMELLDGDYTLWTVLMGCRWFLAAKEVWDRELDAVLQSEAMEHIRTLMAEGMPAQRLAAAKYIANKEYRREKTASKGRPKREDIDRAAKDLAMTEKDLEDDFKRIKGAV